MLSMIRNSEHITCERKKALEILGACAQNNPPCQDDLHKNEVLPDLLQIVSTDRNAGIRLKALGSLSSICRGHAELEAQFINAGGMDLLVNKLSADDDVKVKRKALFFMRALFFSSPSAKGQACSSDLPSTLVGLIGHDDIDLRESCLNAMIELTTANPSGHAAFSETQLRVLNKLANRQSSLQNKRGEDAETAQEELMLCKNIQELLAAPAAADSPAQTPTLVPALSYASGSTVFSFAGGGAGTAQASAPASHDLLLKNK